MTRESLRRIGRQCVKYGPYCMELNRNPTEFDIFKGAIKAGYQADHQPMTSFILYTKYSIPNGKFRNMPDVS